MQRSKLRLLESGARSGERSLAVEALVQRVTMLATPDGEWVFEGSPEFLAALGDPDPDYDATLFAVKNLGFIKWEMLGNSVIEIELHPRNCELPALLAVQEQLQSSRVKLFRIRHFDVDWRSEIFSSAEHAMARLSELCAPAFTPLASDKFFAEPRDFSDLFKAEVMPLRLMAQKWRISFGHFDSSVLSFAIKHRLLSRMMVIGVRSGREAVFRFIGDGFQWTDASYQMKAIGERIENQPDKDYGEWVVEFYKSVATTGQPRYDRVGAALKQPHPRSAGTGNITYERLLLPWKTPSGEVFVTMCSEMLDTGSFAPRPRSPESSVARKSARSA